MCRAGKRNKVGKDERDHRGCSSELLSQLPAHIRLEKTLVTAEVCCPYALC